MAIVFSLEHLFDGVVARMDELGYDTEAVPQHFGWRPVAR